MLSKYILPLLPLMFCWSCAQQGAPSGGPRDEDPPVVLESDPPNYSTRFKAKKIQITFDEYIVLDNVNQQLIVSPPMEEQPEVKLRGKTLVIEFEEELKDSTTYTFNFGSAIKDLHEGNKLLNFEYVFSTGDVLDSLSIKGTLHYAENLTVPEEAITIMLYSDLRDSVPLTDIPLYVGRSDDSGVFSVNNLRPDVYKLFALKDGNNNFLFDLPSEEIAFLDTSLIVNAEFARRLLYESGSIDSISEIDTIPGLDSTGLEPDTLMYAGPDLNSIYIDLMLFVEESDIQYLTDISREDPRRMQMIFARALSDTFQYRILRPEEVENVELLEYFSSGRDSLTLWIKDSVYYKQDSLIIETNYTVKDTINQFVIQTDTLLFTYRKRASKKSRGGSAEQQIEKLQLSSIKRGGVQDLNKNLAIDLDFPLQEVNDSLISFYHIPDSVEMAEPFKISADTSLLTRAWLSANWKSMAQYRLLILPGAFASIYPLQHDTIDVSFSTRDMEYYGQILVSLENGNNNIIIQLIDGTNVIQERFVKTSGEYTFSFLRPGEYRIKFIHDLNENEKWDTGKYMNKLQPEPVEFLPVQVTVRSNWDHDVTMKLEK